MMFFPLVLLWSASAAAQEYELPAPPAPSTGSTHLDFAADHLDYESGNSVIHLKGAVRIRESTWTVKADELWLDAKRQLARSEGGLLVEDGVSAIFGDSGEFDFGSHTGTLYHSSAGHGDWRIHSQSARLGERRRLDYFSADFTSCSFDPKPHYHFHSSRITVVPKKYLLARNAVFYLGPVPLLYTPLLYKSLKPRHLLRFKVQPGYDRRNGGFLKGTLLTEHTPHLYSKLYLDYYGSQGLGTGAELERHKGEDSRGVLYGYRLRETHNGRERWTMLGNGYQALTSSVAFQGRLQVQSDADFNNDYARSSVFRVTPELVNNAAVVYRLPRLTARLSYSRQDVASEDRAKFLKAAESSPRLEARTAELSIWRLPWLNVFDGFADNTFDKNRSFLEKSVGAGWEGTRTFNLLRGVSLIPKLGYRQTYFNRADSPADFSSTATVKDAFVGRYSLQGTLRVATLAGDWDLTHLYEKRQKAGSFSDDAGAPDHGVEKNLLTVTDGFRPTRKVLVRAFSGYDFRVFRDRTVGFRDRVQPIVGELVYTPRTSLNFSLRDDYQLQQGNRSFLFGGQWGDEGGTFLGAGAGYNLAQAGRYFVNADFGWAPSTGTWRLAASLRSEASTSGGVGRLSRFQLFEKELMLSKVWHDFFTRAMLRLRPGGVKEVSIRVDLRLGRVSTAAPRHDWEAEWFPERRTGAYDRP